MFCGHSVGDLEREDQPALRPDSRELQARSQLHSRPILWQLAEWALAWSVSPWRMQSGASEWRSSRSPATVRTEIALVKLNCDGPALVNMTEVDMRISLN